jgi:hypothetical protein
MGTFAARQYVVCSMKSAPQVSKAPNGKASDHNGWWIAPGRAKMSWRMMFKLLLLMALDDWDWRREQKRKEQKVNAAQRQRIGPTHSLSKRH